MHVRYSQHLVIESILFSSDEFMNCKYGGGRHIKGKTFWSNCVSGGVKVYIFVLVYLFSSCRAKGLRYMWQQGVVMMRYVKCC